MSNKFLSHYDFKYDGPEERGDSLLRVMQCREARGVEVCSACPYFDECKLVKNLLLERAGYGVSSSGGESGST